MALPITEHPLIDVHVHSLGKKVKFRPFLVKEEKLLVLANETKEEEEMIKATQQVVTNCSFGKVDGEKIPIFDMQQIFLELRKVSISDKIDARLLCGHCEAPIEIEISLDTFKLYETEGHDKTVQLGNEMSLEMRYPNASEMIEIGKSETEQDLFKVAEVCIEKIFQGEAIYEDLTESDRAEFIDNLTTEQFSHIKKFFETAPQLRHEVEVTNPKTSVKSKVTFKGLQDFFQ